MGRTPEARRAREVGRAVDTIVGPERTRRLMAGYPDALPREPTLSAHHRWLLRERLKATADTTAES